ARAAGESGGALVAKAGARRSRPSAGYPDSRVVRSCHISADQWLPCCKTGKFSGFQRMLRPTHRQAPEYLDAAACGRLSRGDASRLTLAAKNAVAIDLTAVLVAVTGEEPRVLTVQGGKTLPSGPFESSHRSLQTGLRDWVERQTHHPLGYMEQLYTFADSDRTQDGGRVISNRYLPWEDWRDGAPAVVEAIIRRLSAWAEAVPDPGLRRERMQRVSTTFGGAPREWNEELVLQRYELLYEAQLVPEAGQARPVADPVPGEPMMHDHRRILATGIA